MYQFAILGDTHFGAKQFEKNIFNSKMNFFENQFFPYIIENNIKNVIQLGDIVDNRNIIDLYILQQLKNRFFKWFVDNNVHLYTIIGNHDVYYKNTNEINFQSHNLQEFSSHVHFSNNSYITKIGKYNVGLVPWLNPKDEIIEQNLPDPTKVDILCGHFELKNFLMEKNLIAKEGTNPNILNKYKLVLSGHYHTSSTKHNITYTGTPYQITWSDFGIKKGFWVIDDKFKLSFIENTTSSKFCKIYYIEQNKQIKLKLQLLNDTFDDIDIKQAQEITKRQYVKFVVKSTTNSELLESYYKEITREAIYKVDLINDNQGIEDFDFEQFESTIKDNISDEETIKASVNSCIVDPTIDKSKLINHLLKIYNLAKQINQETY